MTRYLTKSRFKLASQCPTKLFYTGKKDEYADQGVDDAFLEALAEGGFQVGELAKLYCPGGIRIDSLGHSEAIAQTAQLLERDEVIIYEAAVAFENLFIRIDILKKKGREIELIEVKAKSCSGGGRDQFLTKKDKPNSTWRPFLEDLAFQKHVIQQAYSEFLVSAHLMLVDKTSVCPTDGLHQKFRIDKDAGGRSSVTVTAPLTPEEIDQPIMTKVDLDKVAAQILEEGSYGEEAGLPFADWVRELSNKYAEDEKIVTDVGGKCTKCEFRAKAEDKTAGLKSGFEECWRDRLRWTDAKFIPPTVLELGNFSSKKKDDLLSDGRGSLMDLTMADLGFDGTSGETLTLKRRQWLQIESTQSGQGQHTLLCEGLRQKIDSWVFPLHFIDFETSSPAIPIHAGQRPYEQLAFQYSHHTMHADGRVEHKGEFLDTRVGAFPNFDFLRALADELRQDNGTIFKYAAHENTILCAIHTQLRASDEPDRDELLAFIESIAHSTNKGHQWLTPERDMIDLYVLVKDYYYDPAMGGSASIKKVLPAVLNSSACLQEKYRQPIYGCSDGIPSRNFSDQAWVEFGPDGAVLDPYDLLPPLFADGELMSEEVRMTNSDALREGGAAMVAYTRMQFGEMSDVERKGLAAGLLRYCELDTLAMVMIVEAWRDWCLG